MSDPEHEAGRRYYAERGPGEKWNEYPRRITYVIDPDGVVQLTYVVASSQIAGHPELVLQDLRRLAGT